MLCHSRTTLYEAGDVVRVRDDLVPYESVHDFSDRIYYRMQGRHSGVIANKEMSKLCGKYVTITYVVNDSYRISEDNGNWIWTDEMFSGLYEPEEVPAFEPEDIDILFN